MKNTTTTRHLHLVDSKTGEVVNGAISLQEAKGYLPKYFSIFVKDAKDIWKLPSNTVNFYLLLCGLMRKGNILIMSGREIARELSIPESTARRHMVLLKSADLIRCKGSYRVINPKYVLNGGRAYYVSAHTEYYLLDS